MAARAGTQLPDWCYEKELAASDFCFLPMYDMFKKHYEDCLMMLELKRGKCPNWVINYIAAFELSRNDQEINIYGSRL